MSDLRFENEPRPATNVSGSFSGKFRLNKQRGKLMGVCSGIADYTDWDVTLIRVAFVIGTLAGFGLLIPIYLATGFIAD
jgi:phage shock protein C